MKRGRLQYLSIFQEAFDASPSELADSRALGTLSWDRLIEVREEWVRTPSVPAFLPGQLWPLITDGAGGREGIRQLYLHDSAAALSRSLVLHLLFCHGVVIEDPLAIPMSLVRTLRYSERERSDLLAGVIRRLATLEPFIAKGFVRIVPKPVEYGTDEVSAALGLGTLGDVTQRLNAANVIETFNRDLWGKSEPLRPNLARARDRDRAVLSVAHQLQLIAELRGGPDLYIGNDAEAEILHQLLVVSAPQGARSRHIGDGQSRSAGLGRHFRRINLDDLPPVDVDALSLADILALRKDGMFDQWRAMLSVAMDDWIRDKEAGVAPIDAEVAFVDRLHQGSAHAHDAIRASRFLPTIAQMPIPMSITVVGATASALISHDPLVVAGVAGGEALATWFWQWLSGRAGGGSSAWCRFAASFEQANKQISTRQ